MAGFLAGKDHDVCGCHASASVAAVRPSRVAGCRLVRGRLDCGPIFCYPDAMPRFAANLAYLFTERPFMERFEAAAAAGFKAVELQFPYEFAPSAVRAALERHGLTMLGINTPPGRREAGEFGLAAMAGREADFALLFRQALDYVVAIGGRQIHCLAGKVPPEARPAAENAFIRNLANAADVAAAQNITLLIEPINPRDRPDYFLARAEHAADIIAKLDRRNVRVQFDFYHAQIVGGDLIRRLEKHLPVIGHVQIAAVPSRHEPDEGEVNYPAIFAALDRLGYEGWIGCEYNPRAKTEDGLAWARPFGVAAPNH
jgi:2-dehydrotetronate isomerase